MRWVNLGPWVLCVTLAGCGETGNNKGAGGGAAGSGGSGQAGVAGSSPGGSGSGGSGGSGASTTGGAMGECRGETNQIAGTQLKTRWFVTAEGDRSFDTFWDANLNGACDFNTAADGKTRCIPNNWSDSDEYFTDEACTQPVYARMQDGPCNYRDLIMTIPAGTCEAPGGYDFFELGAASPATQVYRKGDTTCTAVPTLPEEPLYTKGPQLPPTTFLEGSWADFETSARIGTYGVLGADGTQAAWGWRDTQLNDGEHCFFDRGEDGEYRCLPSGGYVGGYADAACSSPLIVQQGGGCPRELPNFATTTPAYECDVKPRAVYARGPEFTGTRYAGNAMSCAAATPGADSVAYSTTPAPLDMFETATQRLDETDTGRLQRRYWVGGSGGCWYNTLWDTQLQASCYFATTTDGKRRCVPTHYLKLTEVFTDAACTMPAAISLVDDCTPEPLPAYVSTTTYNTCSRDISMWQTGVVVPVADLPPLWQGTACTPYTPPAGSYLQLAPADLEAFVSAELVVE